LCPGGLRAESPRQNRAPQIKVESVAATNTNFMAVLADIASPPQLLRLRRWLCLNRRGSGSCAHRRGLVGRRVSGSSTSNNLQSKNQDQIGRQGFLNPVEERRDVLTLESYASKAICICDGQKIIPRINMFGESNSLWAKLLAEMNVMRRRRILWMRFSELSCPAQTP
jgi:hypothetical protein